jgi:hypothetical protein
MQRCATVLFVVCSLCLCLPVGAQVSTDPANQDFGGLELSHDHAEWPSPESLVRNLRSRDEQARLNALLALGLPGEVARKSTPEEVVLRYASLGVTEEIQAIVGVMVAGDTVYGAVAAHDGQAWKRVGHFSCWCKYEGGDTLGNFLQVIAAPDGRAELVVHASSGGTGVYARDEIHFRYYRGELRAVLNFQNLFEECPPDDGCNAVFRWFCPEISNSVSGGVLVEAHTTSPALIATQVEFGIRELQLQRTKALSCAAYRWNSRKFEYEALSTVTHPCNRSSPHE